MLVIAAYCGGCAATPAAEAPAAPNESPELRQLRADNAALQQRLDDVEAERDRLRERAEMAPASGSGAPSPTQEVPDGSPEAGETPAPVPGLPIVKLAPSTRTPGAQPVEVESEDARPVLRIHGEEEGSVSDSPKAKKKPAARAPAAPTGALDVPFRGAQDRLALVRTQFSRYPS